MYACILAELPGSMRQQGRCLGPLQLKVERFNWP